MNYYALFIMNYINLFPFFIQKNCACVYIIEKK